MLFFQPAGGSQQAQAGHGESRFRIAWPERLKPADLLQQLRRDLCHGELRLELELRLKIRRFQALARKTFQRFCQLRNALAGQAEADSMRVSAEAGKQLAAAFQRLQQVERGKRAAGAV